MFVLCWLVPLKFVLIALCVYVQTPVNWDVDEALPTVGMGIAAATKAKFGIVLQRVIAIHKIQDTQAAREREREREQLNTVTGS